MKTYFKAMEGLAQRLLRLICQSLGVPADTLARHFDDGAHTSFLRLNYYPPCPSPEANLGISRHSDAGMLTILVQDQPGLQVYIGKGDGSGLRYDDPDWVGVQPLKGAFVINIGDMMQVWSNGRYPAPLHRVLANTAKERYSAPFFYNPSYASDCEPLPTLIDAQHPRRYRPVNWGGFRRRRFEGDYADLGEEVQIAHYRL
eukprot:jgi/Chlat1/7705/Chrsp66S09164